jgi:BolA family transcriptional regulator, general stress-responsive regulator
MSRITELHRALTTAFKPVELTIIDESAKHAGHPGARDGRGHFRILLMATVPGDNPREQHQAVYAAIGSLLETDIHALSVTITAPDR